MEVRIEDIKISPILESVHRQKIDDEIYFSKTYSHYISNSRLKLINPDQGGSPSIYKKGFSGETTTSLSLGTAVHELFLQPESFVLGPDLNKPTGKLGMVIDKVVELRKENKKIKDSIITACEEIGYYKSSLGKSRIKSIIKSGLSYYLNRIKNNYEDQILLSTKDRNIVSNCIRNLKSNNNITKLINPIDIFGDKIETYNEDAFFIDFKCTHEDKECVIKFKMKADNWTIDPENKVITLNDLKTTGHLACQFMDGSWNTYHYSRQFASYLYVLLRYCEKEYGYNSKDWTFKCNVIVVETTADNRATVFPITRELLETGRKEFCKLLKMVAYCEMNDYSDDVTFL